MDPVNKALSSIIDPMMFIINYILDFITNHLLLLVIIAVVLFFGYKIFFAYKEE